MKNQRDPVSVLFHDLVSPVSSIRSLLYFLLMNKKRPLDEKTQEYLQSCLAYCDQMVRKLNDLKKNWGANLKTKEEKQSQSQTVNAE